MSPRSEADDTGRKWQAYQKIASLKHYILLSQDQRLVNLHSRAGDLWRERFLSTGVDRARRPAGPPRDRRPVRGDRHRRLAFPTATSRR